jgi:putative hydrolase of the HAD superfamily
MIECLVFDLDDTLCPERPFVLARLAAVAKRLEQRYGPRIDWQAALVKGYEADLRTRVFDAALEQAGIAPDKAVIRDLVGVYRAGPVEVALYADAGPALDFWSRRLPLALVTDGHGPTQRAKVEALGIGRYFRHMVFTDDLGPEGVKPSLAPLRLLRERIGFSGPAAYVGDNPALDFPGPKQLGWTTIRIARPGAKFAAAAAPPSCSPDVTLQGLDGLRAVSVLRSLLEGDRA